MFVLSRWIRLLFHLCLEKCVIVVLGFMQYILKCIVNAYYIIVLLILFSSVTPIKCFCIVNQLLQKSSIWTNCPFASHCLHGISKLHFLMIYKICNNKCCGTTNSFLAMNIHCTSLSTSTFSADCIRNEVCCLFEVPAYLERHDVSSRYTVEDYPRPVKVFIGVDMREFFSSLGSI